MNRKTKCGACWMELGHKATCPWAFTDKLQYTEAPPLSLYARSAVTKFPPELVSGHLSSTVRCPYCAMGFYATTRKV